MDIETRLEIEQLNNDFCYLLDHDRVEELVELFTEDADYSHGLRTSRGRNEIRTVFNSRTAGGPRTARHMQTGLRLRMISDDLAEGESVCMTFAEDAIPPITPANPLLVADFTDRYQKCSDGRWRIAKRHIERIFVAEGNTGPVGQK